MLKEVVNAVGTSAAKFKKYLENNLGFQYCIS
ncbi:hypothetical protein [Chryseobacterium sp. C-71]